MTCEECGSTTDVRTYDNPENGDIVPFCEPCAVQILGDDEFADTCIAAADSNRAGEN